MNMYVTITPNLHFNVKAKLSIRIVPNITAHLKSIETPIESAQVDEIE
jgi:hypothetical protein